MITSFRVTQIWGITLAAERKPVSLEGFNSVELVNLMVMNAMSGNNNMVTARIVSVYRCGNVSMGTIVFGSVEE
jgi:hypothetical protein